jgi:hypothetical protein
MILCFSGLDIPYGCMPNQFAHILFGKLKDLPGNGTFRGDRIYIKPELYGLQQFSHYIGRKKFSFIMYSKQ